MKIIFVYFWQPKWPSEISISVTTQPQWPCCFWCFQSTSLVKFQNIDTELAVFPIIMFLKYVCLVVYFQLSHEAYFVYLSLTVFWLTLDVTNQRERSQISWKKSIIVQDFIRFLVGSKREFLLINHSYQMNTYSVMELSSTCEASGEVRIFITPDFCHIHKSCPSICLSLQTLLTVLKLENWILHTDS